MSARLDIAGLHAGYGEVRVLRGIDLKAEAGCVAAVIGANGAGKTTLMRAIAGILPVAAGTITLDDADITHAPSHEKVAKGVVMCPEGRMIFPDMTVMENLRIGAVAPHARHGVGERIERVHRLFPRLRERSAQLGGTLSGGEQQMLALGRGLMAEPRLFLLDEPTLGLAPAIAKQIFRIIPELVKLGMTVLLAEQDVGRTLRLADHAYVLEHGAVVAEGTGSELLEDDTVRRAYLGG